MYSNTTVCRIYYITGGGGGGDRARWIRFRGAEPLLPSAIAIQSSSCFCCAKPRSVAVARRANNKRHSSTDGPHPSKKDVSWRTRDGTVSLTGNAREIKQSAEPTFFFSFFRTAPAEMPWQHIIWPSHHPSFSGSQRGHFEYSSQPITMICHTKRTATLAAHVLKALLFSRVYN